MLPEVDSARTSSSTRRGEVADLCLVIPAFNEERRLPPTLDRLSAFSRESGIRLEVIVVNDGGSDRTSSIVAERMATGGPDGLTLQLVHIEHRGKGAAVRAGMTRARAAVVGYCDADLSAGVEAIFQLYRVVEDGADVAISSRALPESVLEVRQPWYREWGGRTFNLVLRKLAGISMRDTQCGLKLFREPVAAELFRYQRIDGFAFDAEIVVLAIRLGHSVKEVPIRWSHVDGSKVSMVRDSFRMSRDVVRIIRRLNRGEVHPLGIPTDQAIQTMATSEEKHWWHVTKRSLVEPWCTQNGPGSRRYLDVGCGGGAMLIQADRHVPSFGVDLSTEVLRHTQVRGMRRIARSDAAQLPFADCSFSTVSALDTVEHYALPGQLLHEIHRVLQPDGRLVVTVPAFQWMWSYADHLLGHYRRYTRPALEHDLTEAGFAIERITYFHSWLLPIAWVFRKVRSLLGRVETADDFPLPTWLNRALLAMGTREVSLLLKRDLPFGLSLLAVAKRVDRLGPSRDAVDVLTSPNPLTGASTANAEAWVTRPVS